MKFRFSQVKESELEVIITAPKVQSYLDSLGSDAEREVYILESIKNGSIYGDAYISSNNTITNKVTSVDRIKYNEDDE